jgi:hypothetical protein
MPETWGMLPKSQVDPELIEEAINRIVLAHNEDEEAHLGEGQSLQSHKASEIIDHLINSIIADKIKDGEVNLKKFTANHNFIFTTFDSLDGWVQGGVGTEVITCVIGGTKLETGNVNGDTAFIAAVPGNGFGDNPNFDDKPIAQALIKIMDKGFAEVHFHIGQNGFQSAGNDYIGFFFDQNKVYAVCRQSVSGETKEEITDAPEPENPHIYRVEWVSSSEVKFYIDGVLMKTISTNIPIGDNEGAAIFIGVKNSHDGGAQTIGVFHSLYQQE